MEDRGLTLKGEITMMKAIKNFMNKQWTWGTYFKLCGVVASTHLSGCNKVFARSSIRKVTASGSEICWILKRSHISKLNGYICLT